MQKIVITTDYIFTLPQCVVEKYFELKGYGKPIYYRHFYDRNWEANLTIRYTKIKDNNIDNDLMNFYDCHVSIIDLGDIIQGEDVTENTFFDIFNIDRTDPLIIQAIGETEQDVLKIVEIPDDVEWYIEEGETIHEKHRTWN